MKNRTFNERRLEEEKKAGNNRPNDKGQTEKRQGPIEEKAYAE